MSIQRPRLTRPAPRDSELVVGVLLPDVLGTYSDAGNAIVLAQRARWRAIPTRILYITADTTPATTCDLYLLGGGEDSAQTFATEWLARHPHLVNALTSTATTLAVCAGMQILGRSITDRATRVHPGLGLLDLTTRPGDRRATGEVMTRCAIPTVGQLTGFENHHGLTTLGPGLTALGHVTAGVGNGTPTVSGTRGDGVLTDRIIGTYLHGPVLARNPALADHLLTTATGHPMSPLELPDQHALRRTYLPAALPPSASPGGRQLPAAMGRAATTTADLAATLQRCARSAWDTMWHR